MNAPLRLLTSAAAALTLIAAPAIAQETAKPKDKPGAAAAAARDHKEVLKPVAFEEARYRKRLAQLDRIEQIGKSKKNAKLLAEVAELRLKNDEHHAKREAKLRETHGDDQVNAALDFLEKHGKGKPVKPPKSAKAADAQKEVDKARAKLKDKPVEKP